jgi:hypothetical protein
MDGDFTGQEARAPAPDLQRLPEIEAVTIVRVRYNQPVQYAQGAARSETDQAIEFRVTTTADFPIRALAPALLVGDLVVTESERIGERQYRFVAYGMPRFEDNAPISVGWVGSGVPEWKPTQFRYRLEGEETR